MFYKVIWSIIFCLSSLAFPEPSVCKQLDFPIGIFSAGGPSEKNFNYIKSLGFDYIHRYTLADNKEKFIQKYLDTAQKCHLKVMFDVSGPLRKLNKGKITEQQAIEKFKADIERWKNHPAIGFWYIYDEPNRPGMAPERLMKFHKIVKKETPNIPDAIAICWIEHWWEWTKCADIIMPDFYPVRKEAFPKSMLNQQAEFFGKVSKHCDCMIPIVQCFGFPKYPNPIELRYIMFSTLTQKAHGLFFWSYWRSRIRPFGKGQLRPDYLEKTLKPVLYDFRQFVKRINPTDVLLVPNLTNPAYSSRQLIVGIWKQSKKIYVLMINNWPTPRDVVVPLKPYIIEAELKQILSTRYIPDLKVKNGQLKLHVLPWETFIWETNMKTNGN